MDNLKKYCCFIFVVLLCTKSIAQQKINFITNGNLRTVFNLAKAQNKKVFLEVYSPDCHICQEFEPTFTNAKVAKYYNDHFISYRLDLNFVETHAFLQKQKVTILTTPTFLFYNADVKLLYQVTMTEEQNSADAMLKQAAKALTK